MRDESEIVQILRREEDTNKSLDISEGSNETSKPAQFSSTDIKKKYGTKLVVTIPAYNEAKTIDKVIRGIPRDCCDNVEVLVVDDGSKDDTVRVAYDAGADKVISHITNLGLAITFRDALNAALEMNADIIVNIDADGQYDTKEIPKLIEPVLKKNADIVLGSRFEGYIEDMLASKKIGNKVATKVTSRAAGKHISDAQTGFRAFSREAAMRLNIMTDFTYTQETIVQAVNKNLTITEVPVNFFKREDESRLFPNVWSYAKRSGSSLIRTYLYHQPLKTFLFIGGVVFLIGFLLAFRVLLHYLSIGMVTPHLPMAVLSSLILIVGFQIIVLGLIADLIRKNQNVQEEILYRLKKNVNIKP